MADSIDDGAFHWADAGALRVGVIADAFGAAGRVNLEMQRGGANRLVRAERQAGPALGATPDDAERHDDADSGGRTGQSRFDFEPSTIAPFAINRQQRIDDRFHGMLAVGLDTSVL